jgi:hypothetical protein
VAEEVEVGRVFVRDGPIPSELVANCRARGGEVALLDEGELRGVVFLDPGVHRAWSHLREVVRAANPRSPANSGPASLHLTPPTVAIPPSLQGVR